MPAEENKRVVAEMVEAWNARDLRRMNSLFREDYVNHYGRVDLTLEHELLGNSGFLEAFPDDRLEHQIVIAEGDHVAARVWHEGTHSGEFMGIPPTGRRFAWGGLQLYRFEDGKFAEGWIEMDVRELRRQLTE